MPCIKCQGTVQRLSDLHGQYMSCMMCGITVDLDAQGEPRVPVLVVPDLTPGGKRKAREYVEWNAA
jgi:hypothetical protein